MMHVKITHSLVDGYTVSFFYNTDMRYEKKASYLTLQLINEIDNWVRTIG